MGKLINWIDLFSIATWIIWIFSLLASRNIAPYAKMSNQLRCLKLWEIVLSQKIRIPLIIIKLYCDTLPWTTSERSMVIVNFFYYLYCFFLQPVYKWMHGIIIAITMIKCWSHNVLNHIECDSFTTNHFTKA